MGDSRFLRAVCMDIHPGRRHDRLGLLRDIHQLIRHNTPTLHGFSQVVLAGRPERRVQDFRINNVRIATVTIPAE
jgi:hypothetical protein